MTTSSPDIDPGLLRGAAAAAAPAARLDADLRSSPYARRSGGDPRLVDPRLEQAFAEAAETVRAAARAEGYAAGWAAGRRSAAAAAAAEAAQERATRQAVEARRAAAHAAAVAALHRAADEHARRAVPTYEQAADAVAATAFAVVEELLGRELALARDPGRDAVRRALSMLPDGLPAGLPARLPDRLAAGSAGGPPVIVRLHPADAAALSAPADVPDVPELPPGVTVVPDPGLARGDAVADCGPCHVDARLGAALARVREVLAP